jgi:hypothetical protein
MYIITVFNKIEKLKVTVITIVYNLYILNNL